MLEARRASQGALVETDIKRPTARDGGLLCCGGNVVDAEAHYTTKLAEYNDKVFIDLLRLKMLMLCLGLAAARGSQVQPSQHTNRVHHVQVFSLGGTGSPGEWNACIV